MKNIKSAGLKIDVQFGMELELIKVGDVRVGNAPYFVASEASHGNGI